MQALDADLARRHAVARRRSSTIRSAPDRMRVTRPASPIAISTRRRPGVRAGDGREARALGEARHRDGDLQDVRVERRHRVHARLEVRRDSPRSRAATARCCAPDGARTTVVEPAVATRGRRSRRRVRARPAAARAGPVRRRGTSPRRRGAGRSPRPAGSGRRGRRRRQGRRPSRSGPRPGPRPARRPAARGVPPCRVRSPSRTRAGVSSASGSTTKKASSTCVEEAWLVLPERVDPAWPLQRMGTHHHQEVAVWTRMLVKGVMG